MRIFYSLCSLSPTRALQRDPSGLVEARRPAMVRDSGSQHKSGWTPRRSLGKIPRRPESGTDIQAARDRLQPGRRNRWIYGESSSPTESKFQTP